MLKFIDGQKICSEMLNSISKEIFEKRYNPRLAIIMIGENSASRTYINKKVEAGAVCGIQVEIFQFEPQVDVNIIQKKIESLNKDKNFHGVIIQLPVSEKFQHLFDLVAPEKDVDKLSEFNLSKLFVTGEEIFLGATPLAIIQALKAIAQSKDLSFEEFLSHKNIAVLSRSKLIGKPINAFLSNFKCTIFQLNSTSNINEILPLADIIITATGKQDIINYDALKKEVIIIDSGFVKIGTKIYGDVSVSKLGRNIDWISPVPNGIGPIGVAMLMKNTLDAFKKVKSL